MKKFAILFFVFSFSNQSWALKASQVSGNNNIHIGVDRKGKGDDKFGFAKYKQEEADYKGETLTYSKKARGTIVGEDSNGVPKYFFRSHLENKPQSRVFVGHRATGGMYVTHSYNFDQFGNDPRVYSHTRCESKKEAVNPDPTRLLRDFRTHNVHRCVIIDKEKCITLRNNFKKENFRKADQTLLDAYKSSFPEQNLGTIARETVRLASIFNQHVSNDIVTNIMDAKILVMTEEAVKPDKSVATQIRELQYIADTMFMMCDQSFPKRTAPEDTGSVGGEV